MTENNREEILKDIRDGYIDEWDNMAIDKLFETIEKEHNEIKQYRAIGTVEEIKALKNKHIGKDNMVISSSDLMTILNSDSEELKQYKEVGTVEEFKALKEKNTFNKVIDIRKSECPEDIEYFGSDELFGKCPHCEGMVNHTWNPCSCGDCGGLIDWSE